MPPSLLRVKTDCQKQLFHSSCLQLNKVCYLVSSLEYHEGGFALVAEITRRQFFQ